MFRKSKISICISVIIFSAHACTDTSVDIHYKLPKTTKEKRCLHNFCYHKHFCLYVLHFLFHFVYPSFYFSFPPPPFSFVPNKGTNFVSWFPSLPEPTWNLLSRTAQKPRNILLAWTLYSELIRYAYEKRLQNSDGLQTSQTRQQALRSPIFATNRDGFSQLPVSKSSQFTDICNCNCGLSNDFAVVLLCDVTEARNTETNVETLHSWI